MSEAIERAAQRLIDAGATGIPCDPILDLLPDGTVDDAYAVQQRVIEATRIGARRVGRKIGLTSPVVQQMFGVDNPTSVCCSPTWRSATPSPSRGRG